MRNHVAFNERNIYWHASPTVEPRSWREKPIIWACTKRYTICQTRLLHQHKLFHPNTRTSSYGVFEHKRFWPDAIMNVNWTLHTPLLNLVRIYGDHRQREPLFLWPIIYPLTDQVWMLTYHPLSNTRSRFLSCSLRCFSYALQCSSFKERIASRVLPDMRRRPHNTKNNKYSINALIIEDHSREKTIREKASNTHVEDNKDVPF